MVDGIKNINNKNKSKIFSFEINKDKVKIAKDIYKDTSFIEIIHGNILNKYLEIDEIIKYFPHINYNPQQKFWCNIDLENLKTSNTYTPHDKIDLAIFDGGEYTTYFEFINIKDKLNHILLDDINTDKCKLIIKDLDSNKQFKCIIKDLNDRNGWAYYKKDI